MILIMNANYKTPHAKNLAAAAAELQAYFEANPDIESLTGADIKNNPAAFPVGSTLQGLTEGDLDQIAQTAGHEIIRQ